MAVNAIVNALLINRSDAASELEEHMVPPDCGEIIKTIYNILFVFKFLEIHTSLFYIFCQDFFPLKLNARLYT